MIIKIPIPGAMVGRVGYSIEFDSDKIDVVQMTRGLTPGPEGMELTTRSKMTLEFATTEDAPKWVKTDGT